jgi:hypothetical protein
VSAPDGSTRRLRPISALRGSVEKALPVGRDSSRRPGRWLLEWVVLGRSQGGALVEVTGCVVKEPLFVRLIASDHRVIGMLRVGSGVLTRRGVATTDVPALCAAPQVKPPPSRLETLGAPVATGRHARVDRVIRHAPRISGRWRLHDPGSPCATRPAHRGSATPKGQISPMTATRPRRSRHGQLAATLARMVAGPGSGGRMEG